MTRSGATSARLAAIRKTAAESRPTRSLVLELGHRREALDRVVRQRPQQPLLGRLDPDVGGDRHRRGLPAALDGRLANFVANHAFGDSRLVGQPVGKLVARGRVWDRRRHP